MRKRECKKWRERKLREDEFKSRFLSGITRGQSHWKLRNSVGVLLTSGEVRVF